MPHGQPDSETGKRSRRDLAHPSRKVLITASALTVVAVSAFAIGTVSTRHPTSAPLSTSALDLPGLLDLPTYASQSAVVPAGAGPSPSGARAGASAKQSATKQAGSGTAANAAVSNPYAGSGSAATGSSAPTHAAAPSSSARSGATTGAKTSTSTSGGASTKASATASATTPAAPVAAGIWQLNQTSGIVAIDSTGGHDGSATNVTWSDGAAVFNGSSSQIVASGPVVAASASGSFTVSAWVDMAAFPVAPLYDETAVSEDTGTDSAFYLQYSEPSDRWAFSRVGTDVDNPPAAYRATSTTVPALSTWTHLVGVYNGSTGEMYLYVNGKLEGTANDPTPFAGTGSLAIGRGQYDCASSDWFSGRIKDVRVFKKSLTHDEVVALK